MNASLKSPVILARDGVINERNGSGIDVPGDWLAIPGALHAMGRLTRSGHHLIVMTQQAGIAGKTMTSERLHLIHERMRMEVAAEGGGIGAIIYCPHGASDACLCRFPGTALFDGLSQRLQMDLEQIPVLADNLGCLEAAAKSRAHPVLLRTGQGIETERAGGLPLRTEVYASLAAWVDQFLQQED